MSETDIKYSWQSRDYDILNFTSKEPFSFHKSRTLPRLDVKKKDRDDIRKAVTSQVRYAEPKPKKNEFPFENTVDSIMQNTKALNEGDVKKYLNENNARKPYKHSLMNISGLNYDFLNNCHKDSNWDIKKARVMGEDHFAMKKRGIGAYTDSGRITSLNPNLKYLSTFKENPNAFRKKKEMCGEFCGLAKGYGQKKNFRKMK